MKNIVIVGAGGFGREILGYVKDCIDAGSQWVIKGFIDDNLNSLDAYPYNQKIISTIKDYIPENDDLFVCALGLPKIKKAVVESLLSRGAKFATLVHPTAYMGANVKLGQGVVLCPRVTLTCDILIGNFVMINIASDCGHDAIVGDFATISGSCDITGHCQVGEGSFLASNVAMRPSSKIGKWASVGINSSVILNVKDNQRVFGNPAIELYVNK